MPLNDARWVTVESCVLAYMDEAEISITKQFKLTQIAFRILDELGLDFFYEIKTVRIPIESNGTALLPPDCINWVKVGLLNSAGEMIPLNYNSKLTSYAALNPNRKSMIGASNGTLETIYSITTPDFYNYFYGGSYGYLSGSSWYGGGFKVDSQNGVIILDNWSNYSEVVLEYVTSPDESVEASIPFVFKEALIAGLAFYDIRSLPRSRKGDISEKRDRRHEYYNARRLARARWNPFNLEQAAMI